MNDLLAVIMSVIDGEEDAFWCFAGLLDRVVRLFFSRFSLIFQCLIISSIFNSHSQKSI